MRVINVGNRISNIYMVKLEKGYLLIDTGYPEQFPGFCKKLNKNGIELSEILYVFLTHAHDDHAGFLNELLDNTSAKVILEKHAVERLWVGQNSFDGGCASYLSLITCKVMEMLGKGEHVFPSVYRKERYIILDDISQPKVERELSSKILSLPGHTIDSIGIMLDNGHLFCGDAAMNGFPSRNRMTIWIEDLSEYLNSWHTMIKHNPSMIYPSHGKPFKVNDLKKYMHKAGKTRLYPIR